jgi:hypothetical protein
MKKLLLSVALGLVAMTAVVGTASARGHFRGEVYIGGPVWGPSYYGPGYYPPPYYYPPAPVYVQPVAPEPPPVYVEKSDDYWYYCAQPKAYYPYVKECPQGWMKVVPGNGPR